MTNQTKKRLILHWTTPKNLLTILLFITLTTIIQYIIVTAAIAAIPTDPTATTIPHLNITISPLYHLLPIAVIITLTTSFTHLTTHTATTTTKTQTTRKPPQKTQKPTRQNPLQKLYKTLQRTTRKIKNKLLKNRTIAYIEHRIVLAKALIKSTTAITATFIIIAFLITIAAYPTLIPTSTVNFYQTNTAFLNFVTATMKASENIANTIPPIGAIGAAINNALISASPAFHNTLKGAASALTSSLVALGPTEKYIVIQNIAAWTVAIATLLYSQYIKARRYRR